MQLKNIEYTLDYVENEAKEMYANMDKNMTHNNLFIFVTIFGNKYNKNSANIIRFSHHYLPTAPHNYPNATKKSPTNGAWLHRIILSLRL